MTNLQSTTWHGISAWALESDVLRVITAPTLGAKIVSLLDKRGDFEWLPGPMPGRSMQPVAYGAPFAEQDMAGWDEMFPTILACAYPGPGPHHGIPLPDHGEAWALPWEVTHAAGGELTLTLHGRALPYRLTRTATLSQTGIEASAGHSHHPDRPAKASTPEQPDLREARVGIEAVRQPPSGLAGHSPHPDRPAKASTPEQQELREARVGIEASAGHSPHPDRPAKASTPEQQEIESSRAGIEAVRQPPSGLAGHLHDPDQPAEASTPDDALILRYTLENLGDEPMPYMWAAHPQFLAGADCRIVLPPELTQVVNTAGPDVGWGPREGRFGWPEAVAPDGRRVRLDEVGSPALRQGRKFFAPPDARPAWAEVRRAASGHWLRLAWDPAEVPYFGLWVDEGLVNSQAVVAPEPTTGWYDDLALAWQKAEVTIVPAGGVHTWTLVVRVGA